MHRHPDPHRRLLVAAAVLATTVATLAGPAGAGGTKPTRPDYLMLRGSGTWTADGTGAGDVTAPVEVWLPNATASTPATATATLEADDGTFPASGECEPASAVIATSGDKKLTVVLAAAGRVCGGFVEDGSGVAPAQNFTGRYVIVDGAQRFQGDDGFAQVQLFPDDSAYVFATDS